MGSESPLTGTAYHLVYTAEGTEADVNAELDEALGVLKEGGMGQAMRTDRISASSVWMETLAAGIGTPLVRLGVPPRALPTLLQTHAGLIAGQGFVADMANGFLYFRAAADLAPLGDAARSAGGYAVLAAVGPDAQTSAASGAWEFVPEIFELMQQLKAVWDPNRILNPDALVSG